MPSGFVIRRWEQLVTDMIAWIQANPDTADGVLPTDLFVGSLERGHLEALALMLEEYDVRTAAAIKWAVPESAFTAFGFTRRPAQAASGGVVFQAVVAPASLVTIVTGTKLLASDGQQFVTTADGTIAIGALTSGTVPVVASKAGIVGNVAAGAINQVAYAIAGVDAVQNPNPLSGGTETEGDDGRQDRFQRFIRTLQRGTSDAIEFAAMSTGRLVSARAVEPFALAVPPAGTPYAGLVWLVVDDGTGSTVLDPTVSDAVRKAVYGYVDGTGRRVPGWKAAGIRVDIIPVIPVPVKIRASVRVTPYGRSRWSGIQTSLTAAMSAYFAGLQVGDSVSYQNLVVALSKADPEIMEVNLAIWRGDLVAPDFTAPLSAEDVIPVAVGNAYSDAAARAVPKIGSAIDGGVSITYPNWILA